MPYSVLIVDDEKHTREGLFLALEDDYDVYLAASADEAFNLMEAEKFDVILTDLRMGTKSGMKVIERAIELPNKPVTIMMTAYGKVETAVEAMKRGAYDFLTKPVNLEQLELLIKRALRSKHTETEVKQLKERLDKKFSMKGIVGNSKAISDVISEVKLVAPSKANVLILGDTGTGKELIAQAIHQNSDRSRKPFVPVHCAALAQNILESELFGHEKGAFTGASERRIGRFEAASGGTLFLDEIGEIDSAVQVKLLRFLETRTIERLGSMKAIDVDIRLVCATNKDLKKLSEEGKFREDLYYRLSVVNVLMPSLKERKEDIPLLLNHFIEQFSVDNGFPVVEFDEGVLPILQSYSWPGNIRELRNFAENMVVMRRGQKVTVYDLDPRFTEEVEDVDDTDSTNTGFRVSTPKHTHLSVEENEKSLIRNALIKSAGNRTKAAEFLGMSRRTLHRKLKLWPELDTKI